MPLASELEARAVRHRETREHSYALLDAARAEAKQKRKYNSTEVRHTMMNMCLKKTGLTPYPEQLDLAECMLLGLDATCIAGTGWGKTLPFVLPLFVMPRKIIIIISPLNALEADQASRFQKMGFRAIAINGTTYNPDVEKAVRLGSYSIILVGPKMCVDTQCSFRDVLSSPEFGKRILGMHVDEAHCIAQWGGKFRPEYSQLEAVRALFPCQVPVQITSATMPPHVLKLAHDTMNISPSQSFHLNLGNDRHNITWKVRYMKGGRPELDELDFLLPTSPEAPSLARMMVFFDEITLSMKARRWFKARLPDHLYLRVCCYNARRGEQSKKLVLQDFQDGNIDILLATEAAGMGCDIPDVAHVTQFKAPDSLSTWMQHAGRAGRNPNIQATAVLLIQPSVFQEMGKATRKEGDPIVYKKTIESGLRTWVGVPVDQCRRDVADEYFDNPLGRKVPTGECCDNCTHRRAPIAIASTSNDNSPPPAAAAIRMRSTAAATNAVVGPPVDRLDPANWAVRVPATRQDEHLKRARKLLEEWRNQTWLSRYKSQPFGAQGILPDSVLTSLASRTSYRTLNDVCDLRWVLAKQHAGEVLALLKTLDRELALEDMAREQAQRDKEEAKRLEQEAESERQRIHKMIETAKKLEEKEAAKARKVAEKEAEKLRKAADKKTEKARKAAEKEADKVRKAAETAAKKAVDKVRKAEEQAAEKMRKAEEREVEKAKKKSSKTTGRKRKAKDEERGEEPARKRTRYVDENEPPGGSGSVVGLSADVVAPQQHVLPRPPPRPRPLKRAHPLPEDNEHQSQNYPTSHFPPWPQVLPGTPLRGLGVPSTPYLPPTPESIPRASTSLAYFHFNPPPM